MKVVDIYFFHKMFQVPSVEKEEVRNITVEVRGDNFYSEEVRKVMIRVYKPLTFVQTDKPIYLPGQTGNTGQIILEKYICNWFGMPLY